MSLFEAIQKTIVDKKSKRLANNSFIQEKVEADSSLKLAKVKAKLDMILDLFKSNGIIDEKIKSVPLINIGSDDSVVAYAIKNKRFSGVVYIYTDGDHIVVRDSSFLVDFGGLSPYFKKFSIEDVEKYNWVLFTDKLLDYIYESMYNSKRVSELSIFGVDG